MAYICHIPSAPLNAYINCIYYRDTPMPFSRAKIFPLPYLRLQINFGGTFQSHKADRSDSLFDGTESWLVGLWSEHRIIHWPLDIQLFIVEFKPGGAYPFLKLPLSELYNQVVSLDAIWGRFAGEIRERLYLAPTLDARFALLEHFLLARLREIPDGLTTVQHALTEIAKHRGSPSIRALSDQIGISQKHLITQFKRMVGGTPKEIARLYRFKHVLHSLDPARPVDWAFMAYQSHFYDQSHFNKEFETFTGHSPTSYLRLRREAATENEEPAKYLLHFSTG